MARTVIQIAADPSYLYALCNDGEIFRLVNHAWQPMAPIPQGNPRTAGSSPHFSYKLGASGLRISESSCAATTLRRFEERPDADRV
jgi:hypothetical protein